MIKPEVAADALIDWCDERGIERGVAEFVDFLRAKESSYVLPALLEQLTYRNEEAAQREKLSLESGRPLTADQQESLREGLKVSATGEMAVTNRDDLVGGVTIEHAGRRIDASLHGRLQALKQHLHI